MCFIWTMIMLHHESRGGVFKLLQPCVEGWRCLLPEFQSLDYVYHSYRVHSSGILEVGMSVLVE